ncbi:hypothetical protein Spa2297_09815 [Streptomyces parvulus]|uniref:Uncharacterized protein n=1 Tax=Streptomyces parvulus TaxID=146923 RepID=A0A191UX75_9ACTN|nr:hypothetical protein Spa2297_09815 [Streptomyces parvulus]
MASGGSQSAGSWSAFDRFVRAVTATRERSASRSLAYASRCLVVQAEAPEPRASASGTMWSMSKPPGAVTVTPSWHEDSPEETLQPASTVGSVRDSAIKTSARVLLTGDLVSADAVSVELTEALLVSAEMIRDTAAHPLTCVW